MNEKKKKQKVDLAGRLKGTKRAIRARLTT